MNNKKYCDAMAEVLYYFRGIDKNEIVKIPNKVLIYFHTNASKDYICRFDYNKPLKELEISDEAKALIGMIYINYICDSKEKKMKILRELKENDKKYLDNLNIKYNVNDLFKQNRKNDLEISDSSVPIAVTKQSFLKRIINKLKNLHN